MTSFAARFWRLALPVILAGAPGMTFAQDAGTRFPPPGWHSHHVRVEGRHVRSTASNVAVTPGYRGLTINRAPTQAPDDENVYDDGQTRYNDIASFNPAPAITSGTQFPFGLDGIGGYGLDVGFAEGQDASVYQRVR